MTSSPRTGVAAPLRWWSARQLDTVAARASSAWSAWASEWLTEPAERVEAHLAHDVENAADWPWTPIGTRSNAVAWIASASRATESIGRAMFDTPDRPARPARPGPPSIAQSICARSLNDLLTQLRETLSLDEAPYHPLPVDARGFDTWSGGVVVMLPIAQARVPILLNAAAVEALVEPRAFDERKDLASLTPLTTAITHRIVRLRVELAPCELDLGTIEQLALGDIIPLPHSLDQPLRIHAQGTALCDGFLGRRGARKAVELVRPEVHIRSEPTTP